MTPAAALLRQQQTLKVLGSPCINVCSLIFLSLPVISLNNFSVKWSVEPIYKEKYLELVTHILDTLLGVCHVLFGGHIGTNMNWGGQYHRYQFLNLTSAHKTNSIIELFLSTKTKTSCCVKLSVEQYPVAIFINQQSYFFSGAVFRCTIYFSVLLFPIHKYFHFIFVICGRHQHEVIEGRILKSINFHISISHVVLNAQFLLTTVHLLFLGFFSCFRNRLIALCQCYEDKREQQYQQIFRGYHLVIF